MEYSFDLAGGSVAYASIEADGSKGGGVHSSSDRSSQEAAPVCPQLPSILRAGDLPVLEQHCDQSLELLQLRGGVLELSGELLQLRELPGAVRATSP